MSLFSIPTSIKVVVAADSSLKWSKSNKPGSWKFFWTTPCERNSFKRCSLTFCVKNVGDKRIPLTVYQKYLMRAFKRYRTTVSYTVKVLLVLLTVDSELNSVPVATIYSWGSSSTIWNAHAIVHLHCQPN